MRTLIQHSNIPGGEFHRRCLEGAGFPSSLRLFLVEIYVNPSSSLIGLGGILGGSSHALLPLTPTFFAGLPEGRLSLEGATVSNICTLCAPLSRGWIALAL